MRSFFRALERSGVRYLLISGQASVLYGAATFSEDIDLWVEPGASNLARLCRALAGLGASYYKLTPPLVTSLARRGHGFHFQLPASRGSELTYLDIMGAPPRVGRFTYAIKRARIVPSQWGKIPVVSIPDLVEMKLTQRLSDYEVVSNLVEIRAHRILGEEESRRGLARWALGRMFRAEGLLDVLDVIPGARAVAARMERPALRPLLRARPNLQACGRLLAREIAEHQWADRRYWRGIVGELREMRREGKLMEVGSPVV